MNVWLNGLMALFLLLPPGLTVSPRDRARVADGQVVAKLLDLPHSPQKRVLVLGLVQASPERVWQVLTDYERYPLFFDNLRSMEILEKQGANEVHRVHLKTPWPLEEKWIISRLTHSADHRTISIRRLDGNIKAMEGTWRLVPQGSQTLLIYHIQIDPGIPVIPQWLIDWGSQQAAPGIIRSVRREAERH